MSASRQRNLGIDLFRGGAALYIVGFWHLSNYTKAFDPGSPWSLRFTWVVLASFTFISGYFLGKKKIEATAAGLRQFFKNRFLRIYPLYLLALALFLLFGITRPAVALKAAFGLSMFFPPPPPTLWFITMLLFFYALAPAISWAIQRGRARHIWVVYLAASILLLGVDHYYGNLDVRVLMYFPAFLLGFLVAAEGSDYLSKPVLWGGLILGTAVSFLLPADGMSQLRLNCTLLVSAAAYLLFLFFEAKVRPPASLARSIGILSAASYCMYLIHRPLYSGLIDVYFPKSGAGQVAYLALICLPIITVASYLLQLGYDKLLAASPLGQRSA